MVDEQNYLKHYGVLNMRWGVRRDPVRKSTRFLKKSKGTDFGQKNVPRAKTQQSSRKRIEDMTDEELKQRLDRLLLEQKYTALTSNQVSKGQNAIKGILDASGALLTTGNSLIGTATNMKNLKGQSTEKLVKTKSYMDAASNIVKESKNINTKVSEPKAKQRPKELDYMDDQNLRDTVSRLGMEQQYKSLSSSQIQKGKIDVKRALEIAGSVVSITGSIVGIALAIRGAGKSGGKGGGTKTSNSFNDSSKSAGYGPTINFKKASKNAAKNAAKNSAKTVFNTIFKRASKTRVNDIPDIKPNTTITALTQFVNEK